MQRFLISDAWSPLLTLLCFRLCGSVYTPEHFSHGAAAVAVAHATAAGRNSRVTERSNSNSNVNAQGRYQVGLPSKFVTLLGLSQK